MMQNDALREQCERIRVLLERPDAATLQIRYEVAVLVADVKQRTERYGLDAVGEIARTLRRARAALYRNAAVAERWPPHVFHARVERSAGHAPSWSHWVLLASVSNAARRDALLERVCMEGLSVRAVRRLAVGTGPEATAVALVNTHIRRVRRWVRQSATSYLEVFARGALPDFDPALLAEAVEAEQDLLAVTTQLLHAFQMAQRPPLRMVP
jgi:hypothetical protein